MDCAITHCSFSDPLIPSLLHSTSHYCGNVFDTLTAKVFCSYLLCHFESFHVFLELAELITFTLHFQELQHCPRFARCLPGWFVSRICSATPSMTRNTLNGRAREVNAGSLRRYGPRNCNPSIYILQKLLLSHLQTCHTCFSPHPQTCHTRRHIEYHATPHLQNHRVLENEMAKSGREKRAARRKARELVEATASAQAKQVQAT
jgi:hypothetical protein